MQRCSINIPKKCGCSCCVKARAASQTCSLSAESLLQQTAVHKAAFSSSIVTLLEHRTNADAINGSPLISSQQEATAETNSQSNNRLVMVDFVDQMVDVSVIVSNNGV